MRKPRRQIQPRLFGYPVLWVTQQQSVVIAYGQGFVSIASEESISSTKSAVNALQFHSCRMDSIRLSCWWWIALILLAKGLTNAAKIKKPNHAPTSWQRQACEAKETKHGGHYRCTPDGQLECYAGWTGDLCNVPICKKGCDPLNGYCKVPGECRCRIGFAGELCRNCALLPGCVHGTCNKSFECICEPGWSGLFCSQATCKEGCHKGRGFCESPGDCRCRMGWTGELCDECQVLPGCKNGFCKKPLECICKAGWTGLLCQTPICRKGCSREHGYCEAPDQCRCRVGWWGYNCDVCHPYPGCKHGFCADKPWECTCRPKWTGFLCDERITSCADGGCLNGGTCVEPQLMDKDNRSNSTCTCPAEYTGPQCEVELVKSQTETKWTNSGNSSAVVHHTPVEAGQEETKDEEMSSRIPTPQDSFYITPIGPENATLENFPSGQHIPANRNDA